MSDFSLTLVLQIKTSKIINDMAKVQQKSEKKEFKVDVIIDDTPQRIWERTHEWGCIGKEDFFDYFKGADKAFAIAIKDVVRYDTPIPLPFRPPQNYRYCEVLDNPNNIHSPSSADSSELEASNPMQQENP